MVEEMVRRSVTYFARTGRLPAGRLHLFHQPLAGARAPATASTGRQRLLLPAQIGGRPAERFEGHDRRHQVGRQQRPMIARNITRGFLMPRPSTSVFPRA